MRSKLVSSAALQDAATAEGRPLAVWLRLPVAYTGMTPDSIGVVDSMLAAGVDLAGVNVMTMNYGASRPSGVGMADAVAASLQATWRRVGDAYRRAGVTLTDDAVWAKVGATPMIGQNDAPGEVFSLEDAKRLTTFATAHGMGRVSMWSANRDGACGAQLDLNVAQNTCSGVVQDPLAFGTTFGHLGGVTSAAAETVTSVAPAAAPVADDPTTSPYPIWRTQRIYEVGDKVVWHGGVYEAKWWTQSALPDEPVANAWDTPWRYVGPVLASDRPRTTAPVVATSDLPLWSADAVYQKGDRVSLDGVGFEAKWWTRGDKPDDDANQPWDTSWQVVD